MKIALSLPFRTFDYIHRIYQWICADLFYLPTQTQGSWQYMAFRDKQYQCSAYNYINKLCMLLCSDRQIRISIIMFLSDKTIIDSQNKHKNIFLVIDNEGWWHEQFYQWENVFEMGNFEKVSLYYTTAVSLVALSLQIS